MSKAAIRIEKVKTSQEATGREQHNRRKRACKSSDKDREHLNTYEGVEGIAKYVVSLEKQINADLKAIGKRAIRKDAVKLIEVIVTSDSEFFEKNDHNKYFADSDDFLKRYWGDGNVLAKYCHRDEGTPHKHYFVAPIKDGKFNYSAFINGRDDLSDFQEQFYMFIKERGYEVEERQKAEITGKKHEKTKDWAKRVQKAEDIVAIMDNDKRTDYAIKGVLAEQEGKDVYNRLDELTEVNKELRGQVMELQLENMELEEKYQGLRSSALVATKNQERVVDNMEKQGIHKNRLKKQKLEQQALKEKDKELEM